MNRPDTVQDVIALVRHSRAVDDGRLDGFLELLRDTGLAGPRAGAAAGPGVDQDCRLTPAGVLGLMVERGLLTRYQAAELAAGRTGFWIGGYRVLDLLGRGGMGQVFLAEHGLLHKRVAVKVLSDGAPSDEAARERFLREARAAAALDHPNIVRVFDVDTAHEPPFLVMEYVDGLSLQAAVSRHGTFSPGEAAAVGFQIARGLQPAADVGLVHRDIKPANVLVDRKGGVKILDLGIARFEGDPVSRKVDTLVVVGTIDYLAPEQAVDSSAVDTRADLYALGATLYFLLAGHPPHPDDDLSRKLVRKQSVDPPALDRVRPDVPPELSGAIARLLARSPADRYPSPAAAAAALAPWAAPGDDFPDRLFRSWGQPGLESPAQATEASHDPSPTLLPPTGRILQSQLERPNSNVASGLRPDSAMLPGDAGPATRPLGPGPTPGPDPDEFESPTVDIRIRRVRRGWLPGRVWWWVLAAGALIGGVVGGIVAVTASAQGAGPARAASVAPCRS